jgi:hypothetical protein
LKSILARSITHGVGKGLRVLSEPVRKKLLGIAPRAGNDYATHIPVLVGLSQRFRIERVLELGCGEFSTPTFLCRQSFANVARLDSFDTDQSWLDRTGEYASKDQRYYPRLVSGSMASAIREVDLEEFDLILVDDSTRASERAETIRELSSARPTNVLIVIHDFEISEYRFAATGFEHRQIFRAFTPQTGVVWNGNSASLTIIRELELQIRRFAKMIQPDDAPGWRKVFSRG